MPPCFHFGIARITRKNWLSNSGLASLVWEDSHAWSGYREITGDLRQGMSSTDFFTLEMRRKIIE